MSPLYQALAHCQSLPRDTSQLPVLAPAHQLAGLDWCSQQGLWTHRQQDLKKQQLQREQLMVLQPQAQDLGPSSSLLQQCDERSKTLSTPADQGHPVQQYQKD